jgi:hypothetical protein
MATSEITTNSEGRVRHPLLLFEGSPQVAESPDVNLATENASLSRYVA